MAASMYDIALVAKIAAKAIERAKLAEGRAMMPGPAGVAGKDGGAGKDGAPGKDGKQGETGPADKVGKDGKPGKDGAKGGKGDKPAHEWIGSGLRFEKPDGTWGETVDLRGQKGAHGSRGGGGGCAPAGFDIDALPAASDELPTEFLALQVGTWAKVTYTQMQNLAGRSRCSSHRRRSSVKRLHAWRNVRRRIGVTP